MNRIKNIHLITDDQIRQELEDRALLHQRHARIEFKVVSLCDKEITIRITQGDNPNGNFADKKRLIEIAKETFSPYFPDYKIFVHATPYKEPVISIVSPEWLQKSKRELNISQKEICKDLGLSKSDVSVAISGLRPMSNRTKAMFYYYFKYKSLHPPLKK